MECVVCMCVVEGGCKIIFIFYFLLLFFLGFLFFPRRPPQRPTQQQPFGKGDVQVYLFGGSPRRRKVNNYEFGDREFLFCGRYYWFVCFLFFTFCYGLAFFGWTYLLC